MEKDATGIVPNPVSRARLDAVSSLPELAAFVWVQFLDLHNRRDYGEAGPKRSSWSEIQAWQNVRQMRLEVWQLNLVLRIEDIYFAVLAEKK